MTIQHSKDLLQEGEPRATSEIGRNELALNSLSRADVERGVLYHAQAVLEDMGMEQEVELLAVKCMVPEADKTFTGKILTLMWFFPIKVILGR